MYSMYIRMHETPWPRHCAAVSQSSSQVRASPLCAAAAQLEPNSALHWPSLPVPFLAEKGQWIEITSTRLYLFIVLLYNSIQERFISIQASEYHMDLFNSWRFIHMDPLINLDKPWCWKSGSQDEDMVKPTRINVLPKIVFAFAADGLLNWIQVVTG